METKKKKDRTTGRLLSRRESNSQRCNSISSCVKHLQHPYREDHPTAVHPGSVLARFLSMASAFLGNVPNSWHLQTGLHFTFEFYAPQVLTEGSSDSVTGCLAFQDFLWSLSVFSKISFSGIFPHKKSPHHAFKVCQTGAFRIKITLALEY